jgi:restriction system protein
MKDKGADQGIVVTYGRFTPDAIAFAKDKPIQLIGGDRLIQMIRGVQHNPQIRIPKEAVKICPSCGSEMVIKVARKGKYAGQRFWSCSRFLDCKDLLPLTEHGVS